LPKIIEFCLRIHILPAKMQVGLTLAGPPCSFFLFFVFAYCTAVFSVLFVFLSWTNKRPIINADFG